MHADADSPTTTLRARDKVTHRGRLAGWLAGWRQTVAAEAASKEEQVQIPLMDNIKCV